MKAAIIFLFAAPIAIWASPNGARIVGGDQAIAGEFPYVVAIFKRTDDGDYFCSGSLISDKVVVTAGQCVDGALSHRVLVGTHQLNGDEYNVRTVQTNNSVLHPDYSPTTLDNDVGLIIFNDPIELTTYIQPLHLPEEEIEDSTVGVALGWGETGDDDDALSNTLKYVTLSAVTDVRCKATYGDQITEHMACFQGENDEGTCYGDSGSPLIQHSNKGYTIIIAVSSFFSGNGCQSGDPSGYTKIYPYVGWINEVIAGDDA